MARDLQHHLWFFPFRVGQMLCFGAYHTRDANIRNNANLLLIWNRWRGKLKDMTYHWQAARPAGLGRNGRIHQEFIAGRQVCGHKACLVLWNWARTPLACEKKVWRHSISTNPCTPKGVRLPPMRNKSVIVKICYNTNSSTANSIAMAKVTNKMPRPVRSYFSFTR